MLVSKRTLRYAVKLCSSRRKAIRTIRRSFQVYPLARDVAEDSASKPTVTKKSYSALPTVHVLPDGTPATPFSPWLGGLELGTHVQYEHEHVNRLQVSSTGSSYLINASDAGEIRLREDALTPVKKTRKKRVKKVVASTDGDSSQITDPGVEGAKEDKVSLLELVPVNPKPKRGRKAKAQPEGEAGPVARQPRNQLATEILENLAKFPHCILLTRVGQFYESYFEQAGEVARLLNIKLTSRMWDGHRILMCGFPIMHVHKHLRTLVQQNTRFVALCEEFMRPSPPGTKPTFDRRVVRVITPGTLIDEPFLNQYENNYLLSICSIDNPASAQKRGSNEMTSRSVGLAWIDVSTGEFFTKDSSYENLRDDLIRISPREVVLSGSLEHDASHAIRSAVLEEGWFTSYVTATAASQDSGSGEPLAEGIDEDAVTQTRAEPSPVGLSLSPHEIAAVDLLTTYLHANLMENMPRLSSPSKEINEGRMQIDSHTIKALEIREGMREGGTTGSLLGVVKRTATNSGTRLLARWLCSPSTSLAEINARQSLVALFYARPHFREDLVESLQNVEDATRIVQKFLLGRGDAGDLSAISTSISIWNTVKSRIEMEKTMEEKERGHIVPEEWASLDALMSRMNDLTALQSRIKMALHGLSGQAEDENEVEIDDPANAIPSVQDVVESMESDAKWQVESNWTISPEFSDELKSLHEKFKRLLAKRERLERRLQRELDAPSLTLRSSAIQGLHVHIAKAKRDGAIVRTLSSFVSISESNSTSSFFYQEWSQLGTQVLETSSSIHAAEKQAFETVRNEVNMEEGVLRRNARIADELDVTLGFANLATEMGFVRPTLTDDNSFHVVNGRHPTVELGLLTAGRVFTPNTVSFTPETRLHIITGPNMAGKSTLLRQTALVAILAQTGSFVPAEHAVVGVVDRVFSRIGAKDDLFRDRSTFMVEMLETAEILQRATPNSLVIMDEVGRGTTVKDGLAIAFATVHHLYSKNKCRALFATHFHELTDMLGYSPEHKGQGAFQHIGFFCTDVDETEDGRLAYSHRLRPGVNRDSHGVEVAQLAGMPASAIAIAKDALAWLKSDTGSATLNPGALNTLGQWLASPSS